MNPWLKAILLAFGIFGLALYLLAAILEPIPIDDDIIRGAPAYEANER